MRVLITGGSGVIGHGVIPALQGAGHQVRLLTRHAERDARSWEGVEPWPADVGEPPSLLHAADGCDAVVHVTGIAQESPPEATFQSVNVEGTRNVLREAERAGVPRFVYLSTLAADRGGSEYQRSKVEAERLVEGYPGSWVVLRPGNVYGPGDHVMTGLLELIRALPVVPVIGGDKRFQPIWCEDLGAAVVEAVQRDDLSGRTLELAGSEVTTVDELLERLAALTSKKLRRIHVSTRVAAAGAKLAEKLSLGDAFQRTTGIELPHTAQLTMLDEENVIPEDRSNALTEVLGLTPLPLDEGLRRLALELPEQLPEDGVGALEHKRFWTQIRNSRYGPEELMTVFRHEARELLPLAFVDEEGASPETASGPLELDQTLTLRLPLRGEIQVRVEEADERVLTLATVAGHPLAGVVRFVTRALDADVVFEVEVFARSANVMDHVAMKAGGAAMQNAAWEEAVTRVVERSGGSAPEGVEHEVRHLEEDQARDAEEWVAGLVERRQREENAERRESAD